jgi:hypothetical protein
MEPKLTLFFLLSDTGDATSGPDAGRKSLILTELMEADSMHVKPRSSMEYTELPISPNSPKVKSSTKCSTIPRLLPTSSSYVVYLEILVEGQ